MKRLSIKTITDLMVQYDEALKVIVDEVETQRDIDIACAIRLKIYHAMEHASSMKMYEDFTVSIDTAYNGGENSLNVKGKDGLSYVRIFWDSDFNLKSFDFYFK